MLKKRRIVYVGVVMLGLAAVVCIKVASPQWSAQGRIWLASVTTYLGFAWENPAGSAEVFQPIPEQEMQDYVSRADFSKGVIELPLKRVIAGSNSEMVSEQPAQGSHETSQAHAALPIRPSETGRVSAPPAASEARAANSLGTTNRNDSYLPKPSSPGGSTSAENTSPNPNEVEKPPVSPDGRASADAVQNRANEAAPRFPFDMSKGILERNVRFLIASDQKPKADSESANASSSEVTRLSRKEDSTVARPANPKVPPGRIRWHGNLETACAAAARSGKPVLLFQLLGQLDEEFT